MSAPHGLPHRKLPDDVANAANEAFAIADALSSLSPSDVGSMREDSIVCLACMVMERLDKVLYEYPAEEA